MSDRDTDMCAKYPSGLCSLACLRSDVASSSMGNWPGGARAILSRLDTDARLTRIAAQFSRVRYTVLAFTLNLGTCSNSTRPLNCLPRWREINGCCVMW